MNDRAGRIVFSDAFHMAAGFAEDDTVAPRSDVRMGTLKEWRGQATIDGIR